MKFYTSPSFSRTLERLEIVRSSLRWTPQLNRAGIQKILRQTNELRQDILLLSGEERYKQKLCERISQQNTPTGQRRQALSDRSFVFEGVFGDNPKLLEVLETLEKAAGTDLPVLVEGESGTGKELLAKVIHANSNRSEKPFISVNCGAIISTLLESELFGHAKGAFTGADKARKGKFEAADSGTIFLDEIGELPPESQVKLLRVLQSGEIQRVGSDEVICVGPRVVAATNRNLYEMMLEGRFREDLYYRLSVISVTLPPLRERRDEIPLLIDYFCAEASKELNRSKVNLSPRLRHFLMSYAYRGNIRELRNIIYRISCLSDDVADLKHLPETIRPTSASTEETKTTVSETSLTLDEVRKAASDAAEKAFLEERLIETKGNVTALSKRLNMNRSYLQTLLKKQGMRAKDFKIRTHEKKKRA
ncbi:sigma-54 interaction domain-containing protein [Desulfonema magnum]|uniref:Sigma-54 interaction domain-containing protein, PAS domain-containing n=1 Tax=Desulfonema magnum TaxID=45655 RepID=A0A975GQD8_9BACT|nr:sigma-54 dependent transcriptional regulator [Desulfonema magnum]QTA89936.1 Sigma-54 interaction domain-containing protein, PAS domain-containing [Desulfonema magnum]